MPFNHGRVTDTNIAAKNMNGQTKKDLLMPFAILAIGHRMAISSIDLAPAPTEVNIANANMIVATLGYSVTYGLTI